ncbi:hypothetical protein HN018_28020 (plasmid) [Lichenicola cladoniae]|uniref:Uncharacterized protein n=1 Tax=Lichenicola cladoniae TaxID=1484109 RepID=A0A6M8I289_9PROT|nr:hypothetical protein [Lichenicola cladoniae]NPD69654.1 hypothetical protein [Acetobacteraceae bacterium]QKE93971.1 hypothetical protein HN018_28020 [Lichenicola cladoniae]
MNENPFSQGAPGGNERAPPEVDNSAQWRRLEQTIMEARERFGNLPADELQAILDEAVMTSRQA